VFTVRGVESYLQSHFEELVAESLVGGNLAESAPARFKRLLDLRVEQSRWVRVWEANVHVVVTARDGRTILYIDGRTPTLATPRGRIGPAAIRESERLLPASAFVKVSVAHSALLSNAILVSYGILLFSGLFFYNRQIQVLENRVIDEALEQRDIAVKRTERIEAEIDSVRKRVRALEPGEREYQREISQLHKERKVLEEQLSALAAQELELRGKAELATRLEEEGRALEELLDEAAGDLRAKDSEIGDLERNLKRAINIAGAPSGKAKEKETLTKRMRSLYQNLEIDDRAIDDIIGLRDEAIKLRVEECLKLLSEEADKVVVRRKVGGLPEHLSVYELGFAGKRRLYYMKGKHRRYRVLVIGAKNTQSGDMAYMSKFPKNELGT
jgi:hypothetical protein